MACGCRKTKNQKFLWTPPEGSNLPEVEYDSEITAKAKVLRKGGSYKTVTKGN